MEGGDIEGGRAAERRRVGEYVGSECAGERERLRKGGEGAVEGRKTVEQGSRWDMTGKRAVDITILYARR